MEVAPAELASRTWTDGQTIFLEAGADRRDRLRLLGVQASLLAQGSLDAELLAPLRGRRALARRYLAVEGHRALAANATALPAWVRSMVDADIAGSVGSPAESLARARLDTGLVPAWAFGALDPKCVARSMESDAGDELAGSPTTADPAHLAALDDADDETPALGGLLESPVGGGGFIGRWLARLMRPARRRGGGGDPGADAPTHLGTRRPTGGRTWVGRRAMAEPGGLEHARPATHVYPEWDRRRRAYRSAWCHVVEEPVAGSAAAATMPADRGELRRALAPLGTGFTSYRRQRQGEDIDVDAVVDARVGLMTGASHTEDVYVESLRRRRDLSVLLLLDVSGSAAEPGVAGRPVHEHQREAASVLTSALHHLGDRVALYAFSSMGRKAVRVARVKGFDDHLDGRVGQRLGALEPAAFTRLGAAIRHGAAVLERDGGTARRLLVVLSDGFAFDHGYESRYGESDTRRALHEARARGIGCLCLSVGADADLSALRRVFGPTAHASVPTTRSLPRLVGPLCATALREVVR